MYGVVYSNDGYDHVGNDNSKRNNNNNNNSDKINDNNNYPNNLLT